MKIIVEISDLKKSVDSKFIKRIAAEVIKNESDGLRISEIELSMAFVGLDEISRVNNKYRGKDYATDVLSFTEEDFLRRKVLNNLQKNEFLGELLICPDQVAMDAQSDGTNPKRQLGWVIIHGILHLFGFDHEVSEGEAARMREKEEKYLLKLKNLF